MLLWGSGLGRYREKLFPSFHVEIFGVIFLFGGVGGCGGGGGGGGGGSGLGGGPEDLMNGAVVFTTVCQGVRCGWG